MNRSILLIFCGLITSGADRTLSPPQLNPQCPPGADCGVHISTETDQPTANNLVYIKSTGTNDSLHYFISSINGLSILVLQTNESAKVVISWSDFLNGTSDSPSISFDGHVYNSIGVSFTKLYIYDDADGSADFATSSLNITVPFASDNMLWDVVMLDNDAFSVNLRTSNISKDFISTKDDGYLKFTYQVFGSDGRFNLLPKLLHTEMSSQVEVELVNLYNNLVNDSQTRYGLEVVVSSASSFMDDGIKKTRSMDDEYTPGTFDTCRMELSDPTIENGFDNFIMWKPVGYSGSSRSLQNAINLQYSSPYKYENVGGLIDAYYGQNNYSARSFNISFGISGDKLFYTNYLVWTLEIGAGVVPEDSFSSLVIGLLVICVAVPGVGLLGGGSYGVYSKFIKKPSPKMETSSDEIIKEPVEDHDDDNVRF